MSLQYPHLLFENFSTPLGKRVMDGLRFLFPVVTNPDARECPCPMASWYLVVEMATANI
jgi:hypothetical protein